MMNHFASHSRRHRLLITALLPFLLIAGGATLNCAVQPGPEAESNAQTRTRRHDADTTQIRRLITEYTQSVDKADPKLASQIWWNSPDASFIYPLGWVRGFEDIKKEIYERVMGQIFSERDLTVHGVAIHVHGESAWAEYYWDFHARLRKDGSSVTTHGRETQVYWKIKGRWRLVHVHYSGPPLKQ